MVWECEFTYEFEKKQMQMKSSNFWAKKVCVEGEPRNWPRNTFYNAIWKKIRKKWL